MPARYFMLSIAPNRLPKFELLVLKPLICTNVISGNSSAAAAWAAVGAAAVGAAAVGATAAGAAVGAGAVGAWAGAAVGAGAAVEPPQALSSTISTSMRLDQRQNDVVRMCFSLTIRMLFL